MVTRGEATVTGQDLRLLATDLDGTIVRTDGSISTRTRDALSAAQDAGLLVVFVTGRPSKLDGHVLRARDRFLPKPVRRVALLRAVRGLVGAPSRRAP